jgi:hypothetical protein
MVISFNFCGKLILRNITIPDKDEVLSFDPAGTLVLTYECAEIL